MCCVDRVYGGTGGCWRATAAARAIARAQSAYARRPCAQEEYFYRQRLTAAGTISGARGTPRSNGRTHSRRRDRCRQRSVARGPVTVGAQTLQPPTGNWLPTRPRTGRYATPVNPNQDYHFGIGSRDGRRQSSIGPHTGVIYLGTADGGVWKSTNDGVVDAADRRAALARRRRARPRPGRHHGQHALCRHGRDELRHPPAAGLQRRYLFRRRRAEDDERRQRRGRCRGRASSAAAPIQRATRSASSALASMARPIRAGTTRGIYQSTDGGATWTQVTVVGRQARTARVTDIVDGRARTSMPCSARRTRGFGYTGHLQVARVARDHFRPDH